VFPTSVATRQTCNKLRVLERVTTSSGSKSVTRGTTGFVLLVAAFDELARAIDRGHLGFGRTHNPSVVGSSPTCPTTRFRRSAT
jgi:hypothetical protein